MVATLVIPDDVAEYASAAGLDLADVLTGAIREHKQRAEAPQPEPKPQQVPVHVGVPGRQTFPGSVFRLTP